MEDLYGKITDLENQIFELQQENHLLVTKRIELKNEKDLQIARLQDQLEFASDQADTFAKSLKVIYDELENIIFRISYDEEGIVDPLEQIKNSIPESALKRAK